MKKGNPRNLSVRELMRRRPYEKAMSWNYDYQSSDSAPTKLELRLRNLSDIIVRNPFQKTGFIGARKRKKKARGRKND